MQFVRICSRTPFEWTARQTELSKLLKCFGIKSGIPSPPPISVYIAANPLEELEVAAALLQMDEAAPEKKFALKISPADCDLTGVRMEYNEIGTTGVPLVDKRHVNLKGSQEQFEKLMVQIIAKYWEGEDRLRIFPAEQIGGQLAVFTKLDAMKISPLALERCRISLQKDSTIKWIAQTNSYVEMEGSLWNNGQKIPVVFARLLSAYGKWWVRFAVKLKGTFTGLTR